jgi:hypothetical protein
MERDISSNAVVTTRVIIDGEWTADDLSTFLRCYEDIYNFYSLKRIFNRPFRPPFFPIDFSYPVSDRFALLTDWLSHVSENLRLHQFEDRHPPLEVSQIRYGSRGNTDLTGYGAAARHTKEFLNGIIHWRSENKKRLEEVEAMKLDNDERQKRIDAIEIENEGKRLELFRQKLQICKELGMTKEQTRQALLAVERRTDVFDKLISDGKIDSVE